MSGRVDQILAGFVEADAISGEALVLRDLLRGLGYDSEIYADPACVSTPMREACRPIADYEGSPQDRLVHHYSIMSPAVEVFTASRARKILIYHNITPPEWFRAYDNRVERQLKEARDHLPAVLRAADDVWADSAFNAAELEAIGARDVSVFPLPFDPRPPSGTPDPEIRARFGGRMKNVLYVGRVAPNKCLEDLILAFAWYHNTLDRQSRLVVVGSERSAWRYYAMLDMLVSEQNLSTVYFEGFVSPEDLPAYYDVADCFVMPSRHEGFCLPLVEAMHRGVPVVARNQGGMPEALGGAGVRYDGLSHEELGALIHRVLEDEALRREVLASQKERLEVIGRRKPREELARLLA